MINILLEDIFIKVEDVGMLGALSLSGKDQERRQGQSRSTLD